MPSTVKEAKKADRAIKISLTDQKYMPALTGIRAVAAYMVCFHHYNPVPFFRDSTGAKRLLYDVFAEMHIGVSIFFVLSGFLICYRYYDGTTSLTKEWFGKYMANRFARIYPVFFILTVITFVLIKIYPDLFEALPSGINATQSTSEYLGVFFLNISLLKAFFDDYKFSGISQGWSLTVEECFYLLAPFFMLFIRRSRWALFILPIAVLSFMVLLTLTVGTMDFHGLFHGFEFMLDFTFFGRCIEFFVGMGLAVVVLANRRKGAKSSAQNTILFTLIGTIFVIGCLLVLANMNGPEPAKLSLIGILFSNTVLPLGVAILFYGLITEKTWLRSLMSTSAFDILGKSSYVFYLIHVGVIDVLVKNYITSSNAGRIVILSFISIIIYKFVETPLHKALKPAPVKQSSSNINALDYSINI